MVLSELHGTWARFGDAEVLEKALVRRNIRIAVVIASVLDVEQLGAFAAFTEEWSVSSRLYSRD